MYKRLENYEKIQTICGKYRTQICSKVGTALHDVIHVVVVVVAVVVVAVVVVAVVVVCLFACLFACLFGCLNTMGEILFNALPVKRKATSRKGSGQFGKFLW
eukprot:TRINITY_DN4094_c0_g2_i2.p1 TRINITY_DN4094_c0_g2~~TRINITY_DN4094_c0_g2_i2.p1  ORF type:complete len:102 (+),score=13.28 TRINITY_DN4094_c0_g2_i2:497-802(+)